MTFTGTIEEWIDGNKFGFIRPDAEGFDRVFVHQNEFATRVTGDHVGLRVEFDLAPPDDDEAYGKIKSGSARRVKIIGRSADVHQEVHQPDVREPGTVVFFNNERGFGFVSDGIDSKDRIWFGTRAVQKGAKFAIGDKVEFIRMKKTIEGKGPAAARVFLKGELNMSTRAEPIPLTMEDYDDHEYQKLPAPIRRWVETEYASAEEENDALMKLLADN